MLIGKKILLTNMSKNSSGHVIGFKKLEFIVNRLFIKGIGVEI